MAEKKSIFRNVGINMSHPNQRVRVKGLYVTINNITYYVDQSTYDRAKKKGLPPHSIHKTNKPNTQTNMDFLKQYGSKEDK